MLKRLSAALVEYAIKFPGGIQRKLIERMEDTLNVMDFGAKGDGSHDDSVGVQKAVNAATPGQTIFFPAGNYRWVFNTAVVIDKPLIIEGNMTGCVVTDDTQKNTNLIYLPQWNSNGFILKATVAGYMFGMPGSTSVHFRNVAFEGRNLNQRGHYGISCDTTVNNGVYHVRGCTFTNVTGRYLNGLFQIYGTTYLNSWYSCRSLWCDVGCEVDTVEGAAEGGSDQNQWYGCEFVLCSRGMILSVKSRAGSNGLYGCTLSEGDVGLEYGFNTTLCVVGGQIENNKIAGTTMLIPAGVNPAIEAPKIFTGVCFILNNDDNQVVSQNTVLTSGFSVPITWDGCSFISTKGLVLRLTGPNGPGTFDSKQMRILPSCSYSGPEGVGPIPPSKISEGWRGYNGFKEEGKVTAAFNVANGSPKVVAHIQVPFGKSLYLSFTGAQYATDVNAGYARTPIAVHLIDVTTSTALTVKDFFDYQGEHYINRNDVGSGKIYAVTVNSADTTHASVGQITYNLI